MSGLLLTVLLFFCCGMACEGKNISFDISRSIYSLISRAIALQRAFVMMQVCGRNLPVSVCVSICIFTFELQSKSSAIVFRVFTVFSELLVFLCMKLLTFKMLSKFFLSYYIVCYIIYNRFHIGGERKLYDIIASMLFSATEVASRSFLI